MVASPEQVSKSGSVRSREIILRDLCVTSSGLCDCIELRFRVYSTVSIAVMLVAVAIFAPGTSLPAAGSKRSSGVLAVIW